ncbi:MAG: hypothetical protein ACFFCZ_16005 [Promethearchaeota archaeon]
MGTNIFPIVEVEAIDTLNEILIGCGIQKEMDIALFGKKALYTK